MALHGGDIVVVQLRERTLRLVSFGFLILVLIGDIYYVVTLDIGEVLLSYIEGRIRVNGLFLDNFFLRSHLVVS